jgi:hypothetical protein
VRCDEHYVMSSYRPYTLARVLIGSIHSSDGEIRYLNLIFMRNQSVGRLRTRILNSATVIYIMKQVLTSSNVSCTVSSSIGCHKVPC